MDEDLVNFAEEKPSETETAEEAPRRSFWSEKDYYDLVVRNLAVYGD